MKDLFSGQFTTSTAPALPAPNPFAGFMHDARLAIDRLIELQQPQYRLGRGDGSWATG
ncbi:MAG TPA: hypothetical protein VFD32_16120 [Dehalococcoidia bacterium]|nr:hypothetical protein [Dehalococcoidia bacterium]